MSQSADAAIDRWYDIVKGHTTRGPLRASNIMVSGDLLYSYGSHFELARPLRDKKGEIQAFLLNGDSYSVTTSGHQSHVRSRLSGETTVIIPHSALNSAGIDLGSVQIVHVKDDTWTETHHNTTEFPTSAYWHRRDIEERRVKSDAAIGAMLTEKHTRDFEEWARNRRYYREAVESGNELHMRIWSEYKDAPRPTRPTRSSIHDWHLHEYVKVGVETTLWTRPGGRGFRIDVAEFPDGTKEYSWTTRRHWLGEALIRARVTWVTYHECKVCNGSGRAVGPPSHPHWGWPECPECNGERGRHTSHHRWSYYLSGFDHEEARPLYFFAELPRGVKPATVAEAYEALKPDPVKMAEQMDRPVFRQGDIFGVPLEVMDRKQLKAMNARIVRRKVPPIPEGQRSVEVTLPYVLNTNHTATEVAYLPDGVTLARGTMYHDPQGRRADHARRRIGDGKSWHVVIKNTVPIAGRR